MLKSKIQNGLDEARILVLVTQVLLGFQYSGAFQKGFEKLPDVTQKLQIAALLLMLVAFGLLVSLGPYHQLAQRSYNDEGFAKHISKVMATALLPFAMGLSINLFQAGEKIGGTAFGVGFATAGAVVMLVFWYGIELMQKNSSQHKHHQPSPAGAEQEDEGMSQEEKQKKKDEENGNTLQDRVRQVLTETRVVLRKLCWASSLRLCSPTGLTSSPSRPSMYTWHHSRWSRFLRSC